MLARGAAARVLIAASVLTLTGALAGEAGATPSTAASSIWGGGFASSVAFAPTSTTMAVGSDVGGVHLSTDGGKSWRTVNRGMGTDNDGDVIDRRVAALFWDGPGVLYAASGNAVAQKARILRGVLAGGSVSWTPVAGTGIAGPSFTIEGTEGSNSAGQAFYGQAPRPTGHLIDKVGSTVLVLTQNNLLRSTSGDAGTWTAASTGALWTQGQALATGFAVDPNSTGVGFATVRTRPDDTPTVGQEGVYRLTNLTSGAVGGCRLTAPVGVAAGDSPQEVVALKHGHSVVRGVG